MHKILIFFGLLALISVLTAVARLGESPERGIIDPFSQSLIKQQHWLQQLLNKTNDWHYRLDLNDNHFANVHQTLTTDVDKIHLTINEQNADSAQQQHFVFTNLYPYQLISATQTSNSGQQKSSSQFFSSHSQHLLSRQSHQRHWQGPPLNLSLLDFFAAAYWSTTDPGHKKKLNAGSWSFEKFTWQAQQLVYNGKSRHGHHITRADGISSYYLNGVLQLARWQQGLSLLRVDSAVAAKPKSRDQQFFNNQLVLKKSLPRLPTDVTIRGPLAKWLESSPHQQIISKNNNVLQLQLQPYANYAAQPTLIDNANNSAITSFVSNHINDLTRNISGSDSQVLQQLQQRVYSKLQYQSHIDPDDLDLALALGKGDCNHFQALFSLAAQRLGFQNQQVRGLLYQALPTPRFVLHTWNEVLLAERTIVVDASLNQFQQLSPRLRFSPRPEQQLLAQTAVGSSSISTL